MGIVSRDRDVRRVLLAALRERHGGDPATRIIEELGLGRGDRRVDVAVVNGVLHGFEIKSDADDLDRLPGQAEAYSAALDRATVVVAERHLDRASRLVPAWWGVTVVTPSGAGDFGLEQVREAAANDGQRSAALCQLLWREELVRLLDPPEARQELGTLRRRELEAIAARLPAADIAPAVRAALKGRAGWRAGSRSS